MMVCGIQFGEIRGVHTQIHLGMQHSMKFVLKDGLIFQPDYGKLL